MGCPCGPRRLAKSRHEWGLDLVLVLRYRKAVTCGFHVLLDALGEHESPTRHAVRFGEGAEETARHIREAGDARTVCPGLSIRRTRRNSSRSGSSPMTRLAYRAATGNLVRTGKAKQRDLNDFPGFVSSGKGSTPWRSPRLHLRLRVLARTAHIPRTPCQGRIYLAQVGGSPDGRPLQMP